MWDGCRSLFSLLGMVSAAVLSLINGKVDEVNEAALHWFGKWGQAGRGLMGHRQFEDKDDSPRTLSPWVFSWISLSSHSVSSRDLTLPSLYTQTYSEASLSPTIFGIPMLSPYFALADTLIGAFTKLNHCTTDENASKPQPGHGTI